MPKDEYMASLVAKMQQWRQRIRAEQDDKLNEKYEQVVNLLSMYERMGASAWREEERALDQACTELERALARQ